MSSRLRANRANAAASTGPKTNAGKARSAKNAFRHGLSVPVASDPTLAPQAEGIAQKIVGSDANSEAVECARRIGEAQIDLNRIRSLRHDVICNLIADPLGGLPNRRTRIRFSNGLPFLVQRDGARPIDMETVNELLFPPQLEGDVKLAAIFGDKSGVLAWLDRYERRALSRRKKAIRAYDAVRSREMGGKMVDSSCMLSNVIL
jgi:hypothetical protein